MKNETAADNSRFVIWLNQKNRHLAFRPLNGYEAKQFNTRAELMRFAQMFIEVGYQVE